MSRPRDLSFEALASITGTDWNEGRGELNKALASIRAQFDDEDFLPDEIRARARLYRAVFPGMPLTPPALAKHWVRVLEETQRRSEQATNQSAPPMACALCGGHGFVVVGTRPWKQTMWQKEHGITPSGEEEEWAPCPECSTVDASFRRSDGGRAVVPDPARVREMMRR